MNEQKEIQSFAEPSGKQVHRRATVLKTARFNPRIQSYLLWVYSLFLLITVIGIPLIPFWLIFGNLYITRFYRSLHCELTTRTIHFKKGVWFHVERTIPLDKIQDLSFKEGPLLRYLGLSILKIETAGQTVQGGADLALIGIEDAHIFREMVFEQRDTVTESGGKDSHQKDESEGVVPILKDIRDLLRSLHDKIEK